MLQIRKLFLKLGDFSLKNIDLTVDKGDYFAFLGPTGNGKTVLLECIAGRYIPDSGEIRIEGKNVTPEKPNRRNIGYVPQDYVLFPHLNIKENICLGLKVRKIPSKDIQRELHRISGILSISSILERMPRELSGGEKQRAALARALIVKPKILLLDEPLAALDPITHEKCLWELKRIHRELNITILHVTHNFREVYALANKIGVMKDGEFIQTGTLKEIFNNPGSAFVAEFTGVKNIFKGICETREGTKCKINIENGVYIWGQPKGKLGEEIFISINPENVSISTSIMVPSMDENVFKGNIICILPQNKFYSVQIDIGLIITSVVTQCEFTQLKLSEGSEVYVHFDKDAVNYF